MDDLAYHNINCSCSVSNIISQKLIVMIFKAYGHRVVL